MIFGYDDAGLVMIIGKMVVANNRLTEEIQLRDAKIAELEKQLAELEAEEQKNG
jgi:hypothetical protein